MKSLKIFRNSFLSFSVAVFFLLFSCSQHSLQTDRSFSYAIYKSYLASDIKLNLPSFSDYNNRLTTGGMNLSEIKQLLQNINEENGTNLSVPDHILNAMISIDDADVLENFLVSENLLSATAVSQIETFTADVNTSNFEESIQNYEEIVTASDISEAEFIHADNTASTLRIVNDENPDTFLSEGDGLKIGETAGRGKCLLMYVLWVATLVTLIGGCATLFLCALSFVLFAAQTVRTAEACAGYM